MKFTFIGKISKYIYIYILNINYSAVVKAKRGVIILSIVGSFAKFMNKTTRSIAPFYSKSV